MLDLIPAFEKCQKNCHTENVDWQFNHWYLKNLQLIFCVQFKKVFAIRKVFILLR